MSTPKFHTLSVKHVKRETPEAVSVTFDVPAALQADYQFTQGQSIAIKHTINGQEVRRSYSICSSPLDGELKVGIKQITNGLFSTYANTVLKAGDQLEVMTPTGHFYTDLNADNQKQYLGIAAGSGITPLMSIIKTTLIKEPKSQFTLVYGNRNTGSILFLEDLEALKNQFVDRFNVLYVLSQEAVDVAILNGRIDAAKAQMLTEQNLIQIQTIDEAFLCGPESMIMDLKAYLSDKGLSSKQIHFELFTSPSTTQAANTSQSQVQAQSDNQGPSAKVSVKVDGLTYQIDLPYNGETILDAALKKGADLPFACKGGVCCTCRAKVTQGSVSMDMNFSLEDDEVEKGYILTCQAHPTSEEVFVDFDIK